MAGGVSEPFIRHPIVTSLLMGGIPFVGIVAYPNLPVAPLPEADFPTISVSATLPGASSTTTASAVAQPLADQRRPALEHDRHQRSVAGLPQLKASLPPAINIFVLSDRTQTIRASVQDVQFTLPLTIALVVMAIFVFLRSLWATDCATWPPTSRPRAPP